LARLGRDENVSVMRILNLIQCANLGGMERASLRLMRALQALGHDLTLISLNPIGGLASLLAEVGIPAIGLDYSKRGRILSFIDLKRTIERARADALIMTGHNLAASLALGNVCRGRRMLAMHYHHEGVMPPWRWRLIYWAARRQFRIVSFPSDYVRREAEALYPALAPMAVTIRNPLPLPPPPDPALRRAFRQRIGVPADAPLIGNAGWLIQRKRFDVFLRTAAELLAVRPDAHFVVSGDGEKRGALLELTRTLGIADRIVWTGWLNEMTPFYAGIDVLLFNSDWDAFPTTPLEAMSHGLPVVASVEHGGLGEVLDPTTGWLLPRHDPQAIAAALALSLTPEGRRRGDNARRRVDVTSNPAAIARTVEFELKGPARAAAG
jgi:glycosyltransferase involved in cell wall biosynthesis